MLDILTVPVEFLFEFKIDETGE